ncbi:hypothetical protein [Nesterenkonia rhizosphaerae]|uniref:Nucleotidyltransferase n=1 Tax=Nesterenkonia rhizosphaerae TaxID=1348272 RepID=A0ABP9G0E4_9MICC
MESILRTVHASHLYGLAHERSDYDLYEVVIGGDKCFARQANREEDVVLIHLSRFQEAVESGVPQALEALFSPVADVDSAWAPFLRGIRPGVGKARATYRRTILNFGLGNGGRTGAAAKRVDPIKLRRHALRLAHNLDELVRTGRFNPHLSPADVLTIKANAKLPEAQYVRLLESHLESAMLGQLRT